MFALNALLLFWTCFLCCAPEASGQGQIPLPSTAGQRRQQQAQQVRRLTLSQGLYRGQTLGDLPHGRGAIIYRADDASGRANYTGGWRQGAPHGRGIMRWRNGAAYAGDIRSSTY